jgi:hypothetical protein
MPTESGMKILYMPACSISVIFLGVLKVVARDIIDVISSRNTCGRSMGILGLLRE